MDHGTLAWRAAGQAEAGRRLARDRLTRHDRGRGRTPGRARDLASGRIAPRRAAVSDRDALRWRLSDCWCGPPRLRPASSSGRSAAAQVEPCPPSRPNCPPSGSPALLRCMQMVAHPVNETMVERADLGRTTSKSKRPNPAADTWAPYDEESIMADFWSLWKHQLPGQPVDRGHRRALRQRRHGASTSSSTSRSGPAVKAVDYLPKLGTETSVDVSKIETELKDKSIRLSLDSFVDEAVVRKVKGVMQQLYAEQGYNDVKVETDSAAPAAGGRSSSTSRSRSIRGRRTS